MARSPLVVLISLCPIQLNLPGEFPVELFQLVDLFVSRHSSEIGASTDREVCDGSQCEQRKGGRDIGESPRIAHVSQCS